MRKVFLLALLSGVAVGVLLLLPRLPHWMAGPAWIALVWPSIWIIHSALEASERKKRR